MVFGGDLNSKVSSHAYRLLLNSTELKDTWEAAANRTKVYANTTAAAAAYSYNHSIDHIMATPQWEVLRAGSSVRVWSWKDGQKTKTAAPSDHFPVWAEVRLSAAGEAPDLESKGDILGSLVARMKIVEWTSSQELRSASRRRQLP